MFTYFWTRVLNTNHANSMKCSISQCLRDKIAQNGFMHLVTSVHYNIIVLPATTQRRVLFSWSHRCHDNAQLTWFIVNRSHLRNRFKWLAYNIESHPSIQQNDRLLLATIRHKWPYTHTTHNKPKASSFEVIGEQNISSIPLEYHATLTPRAWTLVLRTITFIRRIQFP